MIEKSNQKDQEFYRRKWINSSIVFIIVGVMLVILFATRENIYSKSDLIEINDTLKDYSFVEEGYGRSYHFSYYLFLTNYNSSFQIAADYKDIFNQSKFESNLRMGKYIKILIPKKDSINLNTNTNIRLFGIYDEENYYLDYSDAIEKYNSLFIFYTGIIFIIIGLIILYFLPPKEKVNN